MDFTVTVVTKEQAANRQLDQAIRLFFHRGDMLAVHTLTAAAFQLFVDLGKPSGVTSPLRSEYLIRPEKRSKWIAALNHAQNFLKHADRDRGATLNYVEEETILLMVEAVELAIQVAGNQGHEMTALRLWFAFRYPEFVEPSMLERLRAANTVGLDQTDRDLWAQYLDAVER